MASDLWRRTRHVCRGCWGPILQQRDLFICSRCDAESAMGVEALCGCGISVGEGTLAKKRLFRCTPNPAPAAPGTPRFGIGFGVPAAEQKEIVG